MDESWRWRKGWMDLGAANRKVGSNQVGFDTEGSVITTQGIALVDRAVPEWDGRQDQQGWHREAKPLAP